MPDIKTIPDELVLEIFSHLDLETLTRCMRVNKSFKAITEHSAFDKIFFRTKAIKPEEPINLENLQINPVFRKLTYTCLSTIRDVHFLFCDEKPNGETEFHTLNLTDSSAAKQNATEPAVTNLRLNPYGYTSVEVKSENAVTVQDMMLGLCCYYEEGVRYDSCHNFFEGFYKSKKSTKDELILKAHWGS